MTETRLGARSDLLGRDIARQDLMLGWRHPALLMSCNVRFPSGPQMVSGLHTIVGHVTDGRIGPCLGDVTARTVAEAGSRPDIA